MSPSPRELAEWIGMTNQMDLTGARGRLPVADRLTYTRLRARVLRGGTGVLPEEITWLETKLRETAVK